MQNTIQQAGRKLIKAGRRTLRTNNNTLQGNSQGEVTLSKINLEEQRGPGEQSFLFQAAISKSLQVLGCQKCPWSANFTLINAISLLPSQHLLATKQHCGDKRKKKVDFRRNVSPCFLARINKGFYSDTQEWAIKDPDTVRS